MTDQRATDPLHGITLEEILTELVAHYGWEEMGRTIRIRCFTNDPSIKSSLQFLRKTPWARKKVETMYIRFRRRALKQLRREQEAAAVRADTVNNSGADTGTDTGAD